MLLILLFPLLASASVQLYANSSQQTFVFATYSVQMTTLGFSQVLIQTSVQPTVTGSVPTLLIASKHRSPYAYIDSSDQLHFGALATDLSAFAFRKTDASVQLNTTDLSIGEEVVVGLMIPDRPVLGASVSLTATGHNGELCPLDCSNHGVCMQGVCQCAQPWGDSDCSMKVSFLELGQNYDLIVSASSYRHFTALYENSSDLKLEITRLQGDIILFIGYGNDPGLPSAYNYDDLKVMDDTNRTMALFFTVDKVGPYGLVFSIRSTGSDLRTQAVVSVSFMQYTSKSSANVYVIVGVLLGCGALCLSCCLVCIRCMCRRRRIRHRDARVQVYHNWSLSASGPGEHEKILFESSKVQLDPGNPQLCTICLDVMNDEKSVLALPCKHVFHTHCINAWFEKQNFCCVCKATYDITRSFD